MTEREKCEKGLLYDANYDEEVIKLRNSAKDLCFEYNKIIASDVEEQQKTIKKIINNIGERFLITAPFWCDYGTNISIGNDFYSNHNLVILDGGKVTIGNNVFIAPNCCISTAGHPIDFEQRNQGLEFAYPINIGDNVWIGAGVNILPGVSIGKNSIIGAGSTVTKDIPDNCIAIGSPCRVLRAITEADRNKYKG